MEEASEPSSEQLEGDGPLPQDLESAEGLGDGALPEPETEVVLCEIQEGLPVAEVKVTNTTDQTTEFSIEVTFANGATVLGEGLEYTPQLKPGQNTTVEMGNMQGNADAVDSCEVTEAIPFVE